MESSIGHRPRGKRRLTMLGGWAVMTLVAALLSRVIPLGFWPLLEILAVSMIISSWIAEWEDAAPGGFNNPDGHEKTPAAGRLALYALRDMALASACIAAAAMLTRLAGG